MRNYHSDPTANTAIANVMRKQERRNPEDCFRKAAFQKEPELFLPEHRQKHIAHIRKKNRK